MTWNPFLSAALPVVRHFAAPPGSVAEGYFAPPPSWAFTPPPSKPAPRHPATPLVIHCRPPALKAGVRARSSPPPAAPPLHQWKLPGLVWDLHVPASPQTKIVHFTGGVYAKVKAPRGADIRFELGGFHRSGAEALLLRDLSS